MSDSTEKKANTAAQKLGAAPDELLNALEAMLRAQDNYFSAPLISGTAELIAELDYAAEKARLVIKKARGE